MITVAIDAAAPAADDAPGRAALPAVAPRARVRLHPADHDPLDRAGRRLRARSTRWSPPIFGSDAWTLAFAVGIIVLPYAFRPIAANLAAFDLVTLTEAARSLGGSWLV